MAHKPHTHQPGSQELLNTPGGCYYPNNPLHITWPAANSRHTCTVRDWLVNTEEHLATTDRISGCPETCLIMNGKVLLVFAGRLHRQVFINRYAITTLSGAMLVLWLQLAVLSQSGQKNKLGCFTQNDDKQISLRKLTVWLASPIKGI